MPKDSPNNNVCDVPEVCFCEIFVHRKNKHLLFSGCVKYRVGMEYKSHDTYKILDFNMSKPPVTDKTRHYIL